MEIIAQHGGISRARAAGLLGGNMCMSVNAWIFHALSFSYSFKVLLRQDAVNSDGGVYINDAVLIVTHRMWNNCIRNMVDK
ncbi:hypothetical protein ACS25C_05080 [Dickeya undicola]|uniref:hypothetical protein n=1 Tax=Dickeya undicola TaxID=1577887 RepID=UPI003F200492